MKKTSVLFLISIFYFSHVCADINLDFNKWKGQFKKEALANNISEKTFNMVMSDVKFLPKVIEYDRFQPEFYEDTKTYISKRTSKNKVKNVKKKSDDIYIHIATFYSLKTAKFLKSRIIEDVADIDKKIKIKKINNKESQVISGPYRSVNLLKNDYIKIKSFGFEELDIFTNE